MQDNETYGRDFTKAQTEANPCPPSNVVPSDHPKMMNYPTHTTIRRAIIPDITLRELLTVVQTRPEDILNAKTRLAEAEFRLSTYNGVDTAKEAVEAIRSEVDFEVQLEVDATGKKMYTNAEQRGAAALKILSTSKRFIDAQNDLIAANKQKAELILELAKAKNTVDYHVNIFAALGHVCDVAAGLSQEDVTNAKLESVSRMAGVLSDASDTLKYSAERLKGNYGA